MKGNHPKRRKDKYNPYKICEWNGHYYIEFKDSENKYGKWKSPENCTKHSAVLN